MLLRLVCCIFLLTTCILEVGFAVEPWGQLRGPRGSGIVEDDDLPVEFGPEKNQVWRADLPVGKSSPILTAKHVFVTGADGDRLHTVCLDRETGEVLWRREITRVRKDKRNGLNGPAAPTPVTDGTNVYAFFAEYGLVAYGPEGKELWQVPLGPFPNQHGMANSPVLEGDKIYLVADLSSGSFVAAFDKKTGSVVWKKERPDTLGGYATPIVIRPPDAPEQLIVSGPFELTSYATGSGKKLWWMTRLAHQPKSVPAVWNNTVFVSVVNTLGDQTEYDTLLARSDKNSDGRLDRDELATGPGWIRENFGGLDRNQDEILDEAEWTTVLHGTSALWAVRLGGRGDVTETHVRWHQEKSLPNVASPLVYQDVLYLIRNGGILTTLDPESGAVLKRMRLRGAIESYYASPVAGDGRIYIASELGKLSVLSAGRNPEVLALNDFHEEIYATPALADGQIYVRTKTALYCLQEPLLVTRARVGDELTVATLLRHGATDGVKQEALSAAQLANQSDMANLLISAGAVAASGSGDDRMRVPRDVLQSFVGKYAYPRGGYLQIFFEDDVLMIKARGSDYELQPSGPTSFRVLGQEKWEIEFDVQDGKVKSATSVWREVLPLAPE